MTSHEVEVLTNNLSRFAIDNGFKFMPCVNEDSGILILRFYNQQTKMGYMQGVTQDDLINGDIQKLYEMIIERVKKELLDETAEKVNSIS